MIKTILDISFLIACVVGCFIVTDETWRGAYIGGMLSTMLVIIESIISNGKYIELLLQSKIIYRRKLIRFSISYLYKIKVNDRYLLVKGKRIDQYQPVGGVYKRHSEARTFFNSLNVLADNSMPIDSASKDDLRVRVKGKNVLKFIKWFDSKAEREVSPVREFCEELIVPQILNRNNFLYFDYSIIKRVTKGIRYSEHFQCYEYLIADIVELRPTDSQLIELQNLLLTPSNEYIWVNENAINRRGYHPDAGIDVRISETAQWIL